MNNKYVRGMFCLFLSLFFHLMVFIFIFTDIAAFSAQSRSEYKILAEVALLPAKRAENPVGRNYADISKFTEESEVKILEEKLAVEPVTVKEAVVPEVMKPAAPSIKLEPDLKAEPKKSDVRKQPELKAAAKKDNTPKKADERQEIKTDSASALTSTESIVPGSSSGASSPGLWKAAKISEPRISTSIAAVDSVIVVNRVKPVYPQISRKRREEGNVVVLASVVNGKVVNVSIEKGSGIKALDTSALTAIGKWSFSPDTNIVVRIPVSFELKD